MVMTGDKMIEDFAKRYNANISHRCDRSTFNTYGRSYDYYDDSKTVVSIEMPLSSFRHMVEMDHEANERYQVHREEKYLRAKYPAVKDAYEQYQMVLALCK
jgi:hypothetical protein